MKRNKKITYAAILVLIIIGTITTIKYKLKLNNLKSNGVITVATINRVMDVGSKYPGVRLYYEYQIDSLQYASDEKYVDMKKGNGHLYIGKAFPIMYSIINPKESKLIITKDDFSFFDMNMPDSLYWTIRHFN